MKLTTAAILGMLTAVAVAGCGPGHSNAAASSPTGTKVTSSVSANSPLQPATASPVPTPSSAPPASPPPTVSSPPVPGATYPGVIADCTGAPPQQLSIRPATIVLTCADGGLGVQKLAWTTWGASTATGRGTFWIHVCVPYCAASRTYAYYPVAVTLSQVKASALGKWFSKLTVTWPEKPPSSTMPDAFPLDAPDS
jgi:hypothetical protein